MYYRWLRQPPSGIVVPLNEWFTVTEEAVTKDKEWREHEKLGFIEIVKEKPDVLSLD